MIVAGEASGDLHGASLIRELKKLDPAIEIFGIGGDKMIAEGMNHQFHIKQMAFLGFIEVLRHLPFIKKVRKALLKKVEEEKIDTIVLIDYPGFNLNIAKKFNELGKELIYYISPQVWAWGKGRIKKIKLLIDKMIVVFPFEETMYNEHGVPAEYVGHPLIEHIQNYKFISKEELFEKFSLDKSKEILIVLPGSRKHEIRKIFPECINAAEKLAEQFNLQIVVACAENIDENIFDEMPGINSYKLIKGHTYDLYKHSKFGIIKSGTSTLEAGLFQLPFVVVYSTNFLTYWLGRSVVKIDNIAMANIILGETVVEELIQHDLNSENIYTKCADYLSNDKKYLELKENLGEIKDKLGGPGASAKAAKIVFEYLNEA